MVFFFFFVILLFTKLLCLGGKFMKKKTLLRLGLLLAAVFLVANMISCALVVDPEFVGTWVYTSGGLTETLTFTSTKLTINDSGILNQSAEADLISYDENANHIEIKFTSGTGLYSLVIGNTYYCTYKIEGNQMYTAFDSSSYPTEEECTRGPFIKQ